MFAPFKLRRRSDSSTDLLSSKLFDERSFYQAFISDLRQCQEEAIIESPFITGNRIASLLPIFAKMRSRGVKIVVNTRQPIEHDTPFDLQAEKAIRDLQNMGVQVLFTGALHRKIAIFDRKILWEGSLNVLSQNNSCEMMRRTRSIILAQQMMDFVKLDRYIR